MHTDRISRRTLLGGTVAAAAHLFLGGRDVGAIASGHRDGTTSPAATGPALRQPGSLPFPHLRPGTDMLPRIKHVVVLMLENHSFDNVLGMLGRGDGFVRGADGLPTAANPYGRGKILHAFHMPTPCQLRNQPSQTWNASHLQYDGGRMDGFVDSPSGPVAMGYWTGEDLPFTYSLARTFPLADRWFCSVLAQTYPNRRFLISGTAYGIVDDTIPPAVPPRGTIFQSLDRYGISWKDYYSDAPTALLYPSLLSGSDTGDRLVGIEEFFSDAKSGRLPAFSLIDPNYLADSEENPQDIQFGEVFLAEVVDALMSGPGWAGTLFVWTYDEHGGYFDHVPPPAAVTPDDVAPAIEVPPDMPGGYDRYGFRVPAGLVSPYARRDYVSHVVHDHTSALKLLETKWNLPALTRRDANASDLLDMVDLVGAPAFLEPPGLSRPVDPALREVCERAGPGKIPPPTAVTAA